MEVMASEEAVVDGEMVHREEAEVMDVNCTTASLVHQAYIIIMSTIIMVFNSFCIRLQ